mgnify:CR=1 FL=1
MKPRIEQVMGHGLKQGIAQKFAATVLVAIGLAAPPAALAETTAAVDDATALHVFLVGKVLTMDPDDRVVNNAAVLVRDGAIVEVVKASAYEIPDDAEVHDYAKGWLVPGVGECHNHTAGALSDLNDSVYLTNPGLRTRETVVPQSYEVDKAQAGGMTTALLIPGSGTNMSGFGTVVKFKGETVDEMILRSPGSIKVAQAGNPEGYWTGVGRSFMNYNTRQTLESARDYHLAWEAFEAGETSEAPEFNPNWHEFRGLFARDYIASVHTQIYQVMMTTVDMLANKLNIKTVLDHSTFDGWKIAPLVLEAGEDNVITINGPRQFHFDRTQRKMMGNAHRWWQGGITKLGVNTDAPVIPQEQLPYQATIACWYGWKPYLAIAGLTRVPAEALMVDDIVGTIEPEKHADFAIWTGDPIDPRSHVLATVIEGDVVYDAERDGRRF